MEKKYRVKLSVAERQELKALVSRGRAAAYPESTDGRRKDSVRGVKELQTRWSGLEFG